MATHIYFRHNGERNKQNTNYMEGNDYTEKQHRGMQHEQTKLRRETNITQKILEKCTK